jgi:rod shape-determining protein MreC
MKTLLRFLLTYKTLFLFILLEIVALVLIVNHNQYQRSRFLNSSNVVAGKIYEFSRAVTEYFSLKKINDDLAIENAELRNKLYALENDLSLIKQDSNFFARKLQAEEKKYSFITAKVINASTGSYKNYITLNRGSDSRIRPGMGVINESGVIGIVSGVSKHFSVVQSLLNTSSRISAKIMNKSKTGSLIWEGRDARIALLEEVPLYIPIEVGDTVVTSGYSSIFPEGIGIGVIRSFKKENDSFYYIEVSLFTNFNQLSYVDVIDYKYAEEQKELEQKEVAND